jgi:hypothetical protein
MEKLKMAKKLFALEEAELDGDVVEMETTPEVGEVADVEADIRKKFLKLMPMRKLSKKV